MNYSKPSVSVALKKLKAIIYKIIDVETFLICEKELLTKKSFDTKLIFCIKEITIQMNSFFNTRIEAKNNCREVLKLLYDLKEEYNIVF